MFVSARRATDARVKQLMPGAAVMVSSEPLAAHELLPTTPRVELADGSDHQYLSVAGLPPTTAASPSSKMS